MLAADLSFRLTLLVAIRWMRRSRAVVLLPDAERLPNWCSCAGDGRAGGAGASFGDRLRVALRRVEELGRALGRAVML